MVLLPDSGRNYLSKLYNDEWMRDNGLLPTTGSATRIAALLADRHHDTESAVGRRRADDRAGRATRSRRSRRSGSASCRCRSGPRATRSTGLVGSISEKGLLDRAYRDPSVVERTVGEVMDPPLPLVEATASLDEAFALLSGTSTALVVVRGERPVGHRDQARPARVPRAPPDVGG